MWFSRDSDRVEALEARGHELLGEGRHDEAASVAEQLLQLGWSGGFELRALALARSGDLAGAIAALEEGVAAAPSAWLLWQLLGNLRSDAGRLDEALEALDTAMRCEGAVESAVRFNRAVLQHRRGEPGKALDDLEPILALPRPPEFAEDALSLAASCLAELGRAEEGLTLVEAALAACDERDPRRPRLEAEHALALDRAGRDPARAFERATDAGVATPALLELGRRIHPVRCERPRHFQLVVRGPTELDGAAGVLRVVDVVAGDVEQAFRLAVQTLPAPSRAGACVERHHVVDPSTEREPGVHAASGLAFFRDD